MTKRCLDLIDSAQYGDLDAVTSALTSNNYADSDYSLAIGESILSGHYVIATFLLTHCSDKLFKSVSQSLDHALQHQLKCGDLMAVDFAINTPELASVLPYYIITLARLGKVDVLAQFAKQDYDIAKNNTAINWAIEEGHLRVVKIFMDHGADPLGPNNDFIHKAIVKKRSRCLRYLLSNASLSDELLRDFASIAVSSDNAAALKVLVTKGFDIQSDTNIWALDNTFTEMSPSLEVAHYLLTHGFRQVGEFNVNFTHIAYCCLFSLYFKEEHETVILECLAFLFQHGMRLQHLFDADTTKLCYTIGDLNAIHVTKKVLNFVFGHKQSCPSEQWPEHDCVQLLKRHLDALHITPLTFIRTTDNDILKQAALQVLNTDNFPITRYTNVMTLVGDL